MVLLQSKKEVINVCESNHPISGIIRIVSQGQKKTTQTIQILKEIFFFFQLLLLLELFASINETETLS